MTEEMVCRYCDKAIAPDAKHGMSLTAKKADDGSETTLTIYFHTDCFEADPDVQRILQRRYGWPFPTDAKGGDSHEQ